MKNLFNSFGLFIFCGFAALLLAACGAGGGAGTAPAGGNPVPGQVVKSGPIGNNLKAVLASDSGKIKNGAQELYLAFTDAAGKPVDVGAASLNFNMPAMGTMAEMNDAATLTTTATPGVYKASVKLQMPGEWQAQIAFEGPQGKGKMSLPVTAY